MKNSNLELFEKFFNEEMSAQEISDFEEQLKNDKQMSHDFADFKAMKAAIRKKALRDKLSTLKENIASDKKIIRKKKNFNYFYILGIIIILALLSVLFYKKYNYIPSEKIPSFNKDTLIEKSNKRNDTIKSLSVPMANIPNDVRNIPKEKIEQKNINKPHANQSTYYFKPSFLVTVMRGNDYKNQDAYKLFEEGKVNETLKLIEKMPVSPELQYLQAHCLLISGKDKEAAHIFESLAEDDFSDFQIDSKYYGALALYSSLPGSSEKILNYLDEVINSGNSLYSKKAIDYKNEIISNK